MAFIVVLMRHKDLANSFQFWWEGVPYRLRNNENLSSFHTQGYLIMKLGESRIHSATSRTLLMKHYHASLASMRWQCQHSLSCLQSSLSSASSSVCLSLMTSDVVLTLLVRFLVNCSGKRKFPFGWEKLAVQDTGHRVDNHQQTSLRRQWCVLGKEKSMLLALLHTIGFIACLYLIA